MIYNIIIYNIIIYIIYIYIYIYIYIFSPANNNFRRISKAILDKFVMFSIKMFIYNKRSVEKALNTANKYINILKCDTDVIYNAKKSLLFDSSHAWIQ